MNLLFKVFVSLCVAFVPCAYCSLSNIDINLSLMGVCGSTCWAALGQLDLIKTKRELKNSYYKKDLEFAIFVIDELTNLPKTRKKDLLNKLNKVEEIIIDCKICLNDTDPFSPLNKQLGIVNMWAMAIENEQSYDVPSFKKGMRSVRSYLQSEKKNN